MRRINMSDKFYMKVGQVAVASFGVILVIGWLVICYQIGYGR
jgi:hypothetical protein